MVKNLLATAGDMGLIPDPGKSPEEGNGIPLQHSCWENPMDSPWGHKESDMTERLNINNTTVFLPKEAGSSSLRSEVPCVCVCVKDF